MFRSLIVLSIVICSCNSNESDALKQAIKKFDSNNANEIVTLCDSLKSILGKTKSYSMIVLPQNEIMRFREIDSAGHIGKPFYMTYSPSRSQIDILKDAGAIALYFDKRAEIFFATLQSYRLENRTISMYLYYGGKKLHQQKPAFYDAGHIKYVLSEK
jgi:hypothetical protein